ncbi:MAG: 4-hydroxy-3-methylbut-2-enyl diphosphate reductase [Magnetococcales bacterium]|nr:4-hydroxy-3-methylbut-2-enyl diphosphate reductase [Magnetococcales bacterium]
MIVLLAEPRGFCAGVDRAISIVLRALEKFGPPVYVRHEIVHNRWVVEDLRRRGAVFVEELDQAPDGAVVIFSAHGVAKSVEQEAAQRPLTVLDATCPLVSRIHREAEKLDRNGYRILLIGHRGHPEVVGTMGQVAPGHMSVIAKPEEARAFLAQQHGEPVAYLTQTTLSVDETAEVVAVLKEMAPEIREPAKEDICYATQNRQNAVKALAERCDLIFVLGAPNSSNSNRLREVAERAGRPAQLIESARDVRPEWLEGVQTLGVTAGASAPEVLVEELLETFQERIERVELLAYCRETLSFPLPRALQD